MEGKGKERKVRTFLDLLQRLDCHLLFLSQTSYVRYKRLES